MDLLRKLQINGHKGVEIRDGDKALDEARSEVKRLRMLGYQIREKVIASNKHSLQQGKWVRFVLESGV